MQLIDKHFNERWLILDSDISEWQTKTPEIVLSGRVFASPMSVHSSFEASSFDNLFLAVE